MGNQALNPCISAIEDEMNANQKSLGKNGSPKHNILNRIIGIATSNLSGNNSSGKGNISELIVRQVQESVMDYIKDQVLNPNHGGIPGFTTNNLLIKLNQFLRPADNSSIANKQVYNFGERGSGFRAKSKDSIQNFETLKQKCLESGELFEDSAFPATTESLFYTPQRGGPRFEWKRPHEITSNPKFFVEGVSRFDVKQGELGDCWLVAAIANITLQKKLFQQVVPSNQSFESDYAGIFHFRFWQYGKWIDVVIDDRLPTTNGRLMFVHSEHKNEFWSALLEKAYAKLHGSYENLKGGTLGEAYEDFCGGIAEFYDLQSKDCPENLYTLMKKAYERNSLMGCSINALSSDQVELKLHNGIIMGHAYSITGMQEIQLSTSKVKGKIPLIRINNPWQNEVEWKGAWSDKSREWTLISEEEKKKLGLDFKNDGEFWMSFQDFKSNFTNLEICNLSPAPLIDTEHEHLKNEEHSHCNQHWVQTVFEGSWVSGVSAGGCRNYLETYAMNPQYLITLVDHDEDDEHENCTLIIALMQKNHRSKRKMGLDTLTIGFAVYEIKNQLGSSEDNNLTNNGFIRKQLLSTDFFKYNASVTRSPNYINLREVTLRVKLPPGKYMIVPSTFEPNQEGEFILRIFSEKKLKDCCENDDEVGILSDEVEEVKNNEIDDDVLPNGHENDIPIHYYPRQPDPYKHRDANKSEEIDNLSTILDTCKTFFDLIFACLNACNKATENATQKIHFDTLDTQYKKSDYNSPPTSVQNFFNKIAGDDMEVDAEELQQILNYALKKVLWTKYKFDGFSMESCRSMIAMLDSDRSGKLGIDEFTLLWKQVKLWCEVFKKHDVDGNHLMNSSELRNAFLDAKLSSNRQILKTLVLRYGHVTSGKKDDYKIERCLSFDAFILCCIKLKHCIDLWSAEVSQQTIDSNEEDISSPTFTLEKFIDCVMYS